MRSNQVTADSEKFLGEVIGNHFGQPFTSIENSRERAGFRAQVLYNNWERMFSYVSNTNTVPAELKRAVLLQQAIRDFGLRLLPVRAFSSVLNGTPLEGTDQVIVPFYSLESAASTDFDDATGYTMGDTSRSSRTVTINKRKYQSLAWSSKELRRQPFLQMAQSASLKAAKLGVDVFTDVLSLVKAAKFPTVALTCLATDFTSNNVAALKGAAKLWPDVGRSLVLDSAYDAQLLQDNSIKNALASGSTDALRQGSPGKRLFGFDYYENPNIPGNGENLVGWINSVSAILFAQAPIGPSDEVMRQISQYEIVTDPESGVSLEYRLWGNADMDSGREVIECNYGFELGNVKALQRLRSAA